MLWFQCGFNFLRNKVVIALNGISDSSLDGIRRALFAFVLATTFAFTASVITKNWGLPDWASRTLALISIGIRTEYLLAPWLVYRSLAWTTWSGLSRVAIYGVAFYFGRLLFAPTQSWIQGGEFQWPVFAFTEFRIQRVLTMLILTWLAFPFSMVLGATLSSDRESRRGNGTVKILNILIWTAMAALLLSITPTITRGIIRSTPILFVHTCSTLLVLWGSRGPWFYSLALLYVAICIDGLASEWV